MIIQLSDHFDYKRLLRFTLPAILTMIFTSIYGVVDGFFVSNYVGKTPFAAVNLIMPFLMVLGSLGFMFGAGGSALIAKTMGQGENEKAQRIFSLLVYATIVCGVVFSAVGIIFLKPVSIFLGADENMLGDCIIYGRIILMGLPFLMLQYAFSSLVITAEKPKLGFYITLAAGIINIVGDAVLVAYFDLGIVGAALATALGQVVGGIIPIIYFSKNYGGVLRLVKPKWDSRAIAKTCANGSSELVSNISMSVISMLYNFQLMKYAGENGVAAYGTIMYVTFIFMAVFFGYSVGISPVISYHYGAKNTDELKNLLKRSMIVILVSSITMLLLSLASAKQLAKIYVGYDKELLDMTVKAFIIFSFSFLFSGFAVFGSSFFTALNDGFTSAVISFLRSFVFQIAAVLIMPLIWGVDGIWYSIVAAEFMAILVTFVFLVAKRRKYMYW